MRKVLRTRVRTGPIAGLLVSVAAAVLFSLVHSGDLFVDALRPEFGKTSAVTLRVPLDLAEQGGDAGMVLRHENARTVIPSGTLIDGANPQHRLVVAYEKLRRPPAAGSVFGMFVVFLTLCFSLTSYLRKFGQNRVQLLRAQIGLFGLMVVVAAVAKLILLLTTASEMWIPVAVVPLWVAVSFDRRTAIVINVVLSFLVASLMNFDLLWLGVMLAQGMGATLLFLDSKRTRQMALAGLLAGVCSAAFFAALVITVNGHFDIARDLAAFSRSQLIACVGGGALAGSIGGLLRGPGERSLGNVPRERLLDLTDLEQPLLKKMAAEAPGSWEHARAMANLAEAAAAAIGADALLTRVGAYYHDLGKTIRPKFFVENLAHGEESPHDDLEPEVSAEVIMNHVIRGTEILREGGIPEPVIEFAYTHHGTQTVEYFWNRCREHGNPHELTEEDFRYPGMRPQTKETAILMLVDSIEAASRTIDPPDRQQFDVMIQRIIFTKLKSGQLDDSGLRPVDLRILANRMVDTLVNMNHHRIKYPWQAKQAEEFGVPSQVTRPSAPEILIHNTNSSVPPALLQDEGESSHDDESGPRRPPALRSVPPHTARSGSGGSNE